FMEAGGNNIGRVRETGVLTEFPVPTSGSDPDGITSGPDGNLWFTETEANKIGRITPAGVITEFPAPTSGSAPYGITAGPDCTLWFTEGTGNKIAKIAPGVACAALTGTVTDDGLPAGTTLTA